MFPFNHKLKPQTVVFALTLNICLKKMLILKNRTQTKQIICRFPKFLFATQAKFNNDNPKLY